VEIAALNVGIGKSPGKAIHCCSLKVCENSLWVRLVIDHNDIDHCIKKAIISGFLLIGKKSIKAGWV